MWKMASYMRLESRKLNVCFNVTVNLKALAADMYTWLISASKFFTTNIKSREAEMLKTANAKLLAQVKCHN